MYVIAKVYIIQSSATPGVLKVGYTTRTLGKRVAELNAQTGTIGRFLILAHFDVPLLLAQMIEGRAHETLNRQGLHYSKEYFAATLEQCQAAIVEAIQATGAGREHQAAQLHQRVTRTQDSSAPQLKPTVCADRTQIVTAAHQAFLADTALVRKSICQQIRHIEHLHLEASAITLTNRLFSSAGRVADRNVLSARVELEKALEKYSRLRLTFSIKNKVNGPELKVITAQLDEFDIPTHFGSSTCPALRNFLESHSWP